MKLMPLANRLKDQNIGVQGQTLFVNMMPISVVRGVLLRSPLQGTDINHELPGLRHGAFQIIVRTDKYAEGEALMEQAVAAVTFDAETQVENQFFKYCRPRHEPVSFPLSDGNLLEFMVWMDCCYVQG